MGLRQFGRVVSTAVFRRLTLAACAVIAASSLTACATFDRNDAAATVDGVEISRESVEELVG
jgi:hypothetical protein